MSNLKLKQIREFNVSDSLNKELLIYNGVSDKYENSTLSSILNYMVGYFTGAGPDTQTYGYDEDGVVYTTEMNYTYTNLNGQSTLTVNLGSGYEILGGIEENITLLSVNGVGITSDKIMINSNQIQISLLYEIESDDEIVIKYKINDSVSSSGDSGEPIGSSVIGSTFVIQ